MLMSFRRCVLRFPTKKAIPIIHHYSVYYINYLLCAQGYNHHTSRHRNVQVSPCLSRFRESFLCELFHRKALNTANTPSNMHQNRLFQHDCRSVRENGSTRCGFLPGFHRVKCMVENSLKMKNMWGIVLLGWKYGWNCVE